MPKTAKLIAVITNNKIEMEWTIANQSLAGLDSSTREVIEELVGSFNSPYADRRKWAKKALKQLPQQARRPIEQLVQLQDNVNKSRERRADAIGELEKLGRRGQDLETIIPVLIQGLKEINAVDGASGVALVKLGSRAVPALITVLSDEPSLWSVVSSILGKIGDTRAAEPLTKFLREEWYPVYIEKKRFDEDPKGKVLNITEGKNLLDMLEASIKKYQNNLLTTAEIIEELVEIARQIRTVDGLAEKLELSKDEFAFYTALEINDSAVKILGDETLKNIAREIADKVRKNATIDWTMKESARAKLMVIVKRTLNKYGYPPDKQQKAVDTVLRQAKVLADYWVEQTIDAAI